MTARIRSRMVLAIGLTLQLVASRAVAADKLSVDLVPLGPRVRNEAPVTVKARFNWDSTRILEGRLEIVFLEGNRVLGRYRSGEMALTGGEQEFRMLLPPSLVPFSDSQVLVQMKFVTAGNVIDVEPSALFVPTAGERSLVVGWCAPSTAAGWQHSGIEPNLVLERFAPPSDDVSRRLLMTSVVRLDPEDLPVQPLAYTSFDLVVLTADAFSQANERQLQALARWVQGGGSVCVFVAGGLQPHHLWFLNQLAEFTSDGPAFLSDAAGNLLPARREMIEPAFRPGPKRHCARSNCRGPQYELAGLPEGCRVFVEAAKQPGAGDCGPGSLGTAREFFDAGQFLSARAAALSEQPTIRRAVGLLGPTNRSRRRTDEAVAAHHGSAHPVFCAAGAARFVPANDRAGGLFCAWASSGGDGPLGCSFPQPASRSRSRPCSWPIIISACATSGARSSSWTSPGTVRRCAGTNTNWSSPPATNNP